MPSERQVLRVLVELRDVRFDADELCNPIFVETCAFVAVDETLVNANEVIALVTRDVVAIRFELELTFVLVNVEPLKREEIVGFA